MTWEPRCSGHSQSSDESLDRQHGAKVVPPFLSDYNLHGDLVRRVRAHEPGADEELHAFVVKCVRYRFLKEFGRVQLAEDRVHDTYISVLTSIRGDTLVEPERLVGYVQTIAKRTIIRAIKSKSAESRTTPVEQISLAAPDSPFDYQAQKEHVALLEAAIRQLPPRERELLQRYYAAEEDESTICREMGLTATQFRLTKSRGKQRLVDIAQRLLKRGMPC